MTKDTPGSKPRKKITISDAIVPTIGWGLLFIVLFFGGIAAVANSTLWGLVGIAAGLYFAWKVAELWIAYITLKKEGQL